MNDTMTSFFYKGLLENVLLSLRNDYKDNFDTLRYGEEVQKNTIAGKLYSAPLISDRFFNKSNYTALLNSAYATMQHPDFDKLEWLSSRLANDESKKLLIDIISYRMLGYKRVKLPSNNAAYHEAVRKCALAEIKGDVMKVNFPGYDHLSLFDLKEAGYDIKLYFGLLGTLYTFQIEQYYYSALQTEICVQPGDVVIDAGGCWGDTALYFASKAGGKGHVFSYEFIPQNLQVFEKNLSLNPHLAPSIEVIRQPLWDKEGIVTHYVDKGPGSTVSFEKIAAGSSGTVETTTIDALVREKGLDRVDFIKMDIEGAEPYALGGAENTIKKFRPKLAIAIYHSLSDFVNIPLYIDSLDLGYRFYLSHKTINEEETVLFATAN